MPPKKAATPSSGGGIEENEIPELAWCPPLMDAIEKTLDECEKYAGQNQDFNREGLKMSLILPVVEAKSNFTRLYRKVKLYEEAWQKLMAADTAIQAEYGLAVPQSAPPTRGRGRPRGTAGKAPASSPADGPATVAEPDPASKAPASSSAASPKQKKPRATRKPFDPKTVKIMLGKTKIRREFPGFGLFGGVVASRRTGAPGAGEADLYRVNYEDGDTEDFTEEELRRYIVPPQRQPRKPRQSAPPAVAAPAAAAAAVAAPAAASTPATKNPPPAAAAALSAKNAPADPRGSGSPTTPGAAPAAGTGTAVAAAPAAAAAAPTPAPARRPSLSTAAPPPGTAGPAPAAAAAAAAASSPPSSQGRRSPPVPGSPTAPAAAQPAAPDSPAPLLSGAAAAAAAAVAAAATAEAAGKPAPTKKRGRSAGQKSKSGTPSIPPKKRKSSGGPYSHHSSKKTTVGRLKQNTADTKSTKSSLSKLDTATKKKVEEIDKLLPLENLEGDPVRAVGLAYEERFAGYGWFRAQVKAVVPDKRDGRPALLLEYEDDSDGVKKLSVFVKKLEEYRKKLITEGAASKTAKKKSSGPVII